MGGFFFLRFINPIVVTPDGHNVTSKKFGKVPRRNLTLIAKVLQNLSNGVAFGAKEAFFTPLNSFLENNAARLEAFFTKLALRTFVAIWHVKPVDTRPSNVALRTLRS